MRLAMLTGLAAAALVAGASGAQADIIYVTEPYVTTAPRYIYHVQTPVMAPGYVAADRGYTVIAPPPTAAFAPPPSPFFIAPPPAQVVVAPAPAQVVLAPAPAQVVVAPRPTRVVVAPRSTRVAVAPSRARVVVAPAPAQVLVAAPPEIIDPPMVVAPREGIVTTGFSTERRCFIDFRGMERCY